MQAPDPTYGGLFLVLLAVAGIAVGLLRKTSVGERWLLAGGALVMAGVTLIARNLETAPLAVLGLLICAVGSRLLARARAELRQAGGTRAGLWAVVLLLPIAFFGAVVAGGVLVTLLAGPAQAAMQMFGR